MNERVTQIIDVPADPSGSAAFSPQPTGQHPVQKWEPPARQRPDEKTIGVVNSFTGEKRDVVIRPGTRPKDLIRALGWQMPEEDIILRVSNGGEEFRAGDNLFERLPHGSIVYAASDVKAGFPSRAELIAQAVAKAKEGQEAKRTALLQRYGHYDEPVEVAVLDKPAAVRPQATPPWVVAPAPPPEPKIVAPPAAPPAPVVPVPPAVSRPAPMVIDRAQEPYWKERGWTQNGKTYCGFYKTKYGNCEGKVVQRVGGEATPWIFLPPDVQKRMENHSHWVCFHADRPKGWFRINLMVASKDPSSAILEVENMIVEAYAGER